MVISLLIKKFFSAVFAKYVLLGVGGIILTIGGTYVVTEFLQANYFLPYAIIFGISTAYNFLIAKKYIFKAQGSHGRMFAKYVISLGIFYCLNLLLVNFFEGALHIHYTLVIAFVTALLFAIKFVVYDRLVFVSEKSKHIDERIDER